MINDIIEIVVGEANFALDGEVLKAVRNVGINVDKDKLIEALQLAEKLVRCRECKWWADAEDYDCRIHSGAFGGNDFCSYGERKESE